MTSNNSFPQIPSRVWWGFRQLLKRNPNAKYNADMLAASLDVQLAAARQYLAELKRLGVLDDEGSATSTGLKWRQDETYAEAVDEISKIYPDDLTVIAPPGSADRQTIINWFMRQQLGEGSAKNKTATYMLVTSAEPGDAVSRPSNPKDSESTTSRKPRKRSKSSPPTADDVESNRDSAPTNHTPIDAFPLNVNVQIHISADASSDQIEMIFQSMRKYLRND